ncbi:hypothetical protein B0H14DRAFT_2867395, partial [Mycena olivaceomarginata]
LLCSQSMRIILILYGLIRLGDPRSIRGKAMFEQVTECFLLPTSHIVRKVPNARNLKPQTRGSEIINSFQFLHAHDENGFNNSVIHFGVAGN